MGDFIICVTMLTFFYINRWEHVFVWRTVLYKLVIVIGRIYVYMCVCCYGIYMCVYEIKKL